MENGFKFFDKCIGWNGIIILWENLLVLCSNSELYWLIW